MLFQRRDDPVDRDMVDITPMPIGRAVPMRELANDYGGPADPGRRAGEVDALAMTAPTRL